MTITEAITAADTLKPNTYTSAQKIFWLSCLDGRIFREIILTHEDYEGEIFEGYASDVDTDTVLYVVHPFEDLYIYYLMAQYAQADGEVAKYNLYITLFNNLMSSYQAYYNRTHMPSSQVTPYFNYGDTEEDDEDTVTFALADPLA